MVLDCFEVQIEYNSDCKLIIMMSPETNSMGKMRIICLINEMSKMSIKICMPKCVNDAQYYCTCTIIKCSPLARFHNLQFAHFLIRQNE